MAGHPNFSAAAFTLNKEKPLSDVVFTSRGPVILYFEALQPIDEKKFEEVKKDFEESLYSAERVRVMNDIINTLREKAKLENYIAKINAQQKNAMEKMRVRR